MGGNSPEFRSSGFQQPDVFLSRAVEPEASGFERESQAKFVTILLRIGCPERR
jgi:hypothetical protein